MGRYANLAQEMRDLERTAWQETATSLADLVEDLNSKAGRTVARLHSGELMKPAATEDMPAWKDAYHQAVEAAFAECRPALAMPCQRVHLGDWFELTRNVPATALPAALQIGIGRKYTADFKRSTSRRYFHMIRLPLPRFWPRSWRPIISRAILES